jgi:hypothetical protein
MLPANLNKQYTIEIRCLDVTDDQHALMRDKMLELARAFKHAVEHTASPAIKVHSSAAFSDDFFHGHKEICSV